MSWISFRKLAALTTPVSPRVKNLLIELDLLREAHQFVPPGHFYSPIPSLVDIRQNESRLFGRPPTHLPGIDLNEKEQLELFYSFSTYYAEMPFPQYPSVRGRFFFENPAYSYSDAVFLYCMLRHLRPQHVIEIGSGYSSAVTLDTNELFFENRIRCTFIDPFPNTLQSILRNDDTRRIKILPMRVQDVPLDLFSNLRENDILFIDSTHVSKIGSDVNYIFAEILPMISRGVYLHFHDIFYPFEYPAAWVYEGRHWNEAYVLRAFLSFNSAFKIILFNTFLEHFHRHEFERHMQLCLRNEGGSIWLKRVA